MTQAFFLVFGVCVCVWCVFGVGQDFLGGEYYFFFFFLDLP